MIRKVISLLFIILLIASGPFFFRRYWVDYKESYEDKQNVKEWEGVITFWDYPKTDVTTGSSLSWVSKKIREFEKLHPGVYIDFRSIDLSNGKLTLRAAAKIGANPDIAPIGSDMYFLSSGLLEPLDNYITDEEKKDFLEDALSSCIYNGNLYGMPWARKAYTMLLNKDIFQEKEVDLPVEGFWTYEEFAESLKKLTSSGKKRGEPEGYGLMAYIDPGHYNIYGIIMGDGAKIMDDTAKDYSFDSPEAISGLKKLATLKNEYKVVYPEIENLTQSKAFNLFLNGKAAVFLGDGWMVPYLKNVGSKYGMDFTVAHYPGAEKESPHYLIDKYYSYGIFKQEDERKKEICGEFIKFLADKSFQEELNKFGFFPVRKSCNYIYQNDKEMYTIQKGLDFAIHVSNHEYWWEIDEILRFAITDVLMNNKAPDKALEEAKEQAKNYIITGEP